MPSIIFLHGFNDKDAGADNIDLLAPYAVKRGYTPVTEALDYGWRGLLGVRFNNRRTARRLIDVYRPGDVLVGYSNGCAIIALALEMGLPAKQVIMIHPALDSDWTPPRHSTRLLVYFSGYDNATRAAGWLHRFSPLNLIFGRHMWGNMGTVGPQDKPNIIGYNDSETHSSWTGNLSLYLSSIRTFKK